MNHMQSIEAWPRPVNHRVFLTQLKNFQALHFTLNFFKLLTKQCKSIVISALLWHHLSIAQKLNWQKAKCLSTNHLKFQRVSGWNILRNWLIYVVYHFLKNKFTHSTLFWSWDERTFIEKAGSKPAQKVIHVLQKCCSYFLV